MPAMRVAVDGRSVTAKTVGAIDLLAGPGISIAANIDDPNDQIDITLSNNHAFTKTDAVDNYPRWAITGSQTPTAGRVHLQGIYLPVKTYTTMTFHKGGTAGTTLANVYAGLYDTSGNLLATSSESAAAVEAISASTAVPITVNYSVTSYGLYYAAILVGSAGAMLNFYRTSVAGAAAYNTNVGPRIMAALTATSQTTLPASGTIGDPVSVADHFWVQYK